MTEPREAVFGDIDNEGRVLDDSPRTPQGYSLPSTSGNASAGTSSSSSALSPSLRPSVPGCSSDSSPVILRCSQRKPEEMREQLMNAVGDDRMVDIQNLLETGIDVNFKRGTLTPLMLAALKANARSVDLLLKKGANVRMRSGLGSTALHFAINDRSGQCVQLLINAGADVNCMNASRNTPLHYAAPFHEHLVQILLDAGASKSVINSDGKMPYELAVTSSIRERLRP